MRRLNPIPWLIAFALILAGTALLRLSPFVALFLYLIAGMTLETLAA